MSAHCRSSLGRMAQFLYRLFNPNHFHVNAALKQTSLQTTSCPHHHCNPQAKILYVKNVLVSIPNCEIKNKKEWHWPVFHGRMGRGGGQYVIYQYVKHVTQGGFVSASNETEFFFPETIYSTGTGSEIRDKKSRSRINIPDPKH